MRMQQQQKGNKLGNFSVETVISKPQNQDPTNGSKKQLLHFAASTLLFVLSASSSSPYSPPGVQA